MRAIRQFCHCRYPAQVMCNHGQLPSADTGPTGLICSSTETSALSSRPTCTTPASEPGHCVSSKLECVTPMTASSMQPTAISAAVRAHSQAMEAASDTIQFPMRQNTVLPAVTVCTRLPSESQFETLGAIRARREPIPLRRRSHSCVQPPLLSPSLSSPLSSSLLSTALSWQRPSDSGLCWTQEGRAREGSQTHQFETTNGHCIGHTPSPTVHQWQEPDLGRSELTPWLATQGHIGEQRDNIRATLSHLNADAIARRWSQPDLGLLDLAAWGTAQWPRSQPQPQLQPPLRNGPPDHAAEWAGTDSLNIHRKRPDVQSGFGSARPHLSPEVSFTPHAVDAVGAVVGQKQNSGSTNCRRTSLANYDEAESPKADRRFTCPLCHDRPRSFGRPSALRIHMLTHNGEKRE